MNRGPQPSAARTATYKPFVEKLGERLGDAVPDWLVVLGEECDAKGLKAVAKRLTYSHTVLSQVLSGTYRGDVVRVQETVQGALMGAVVMCPVLGEIDRSRCLKEQREPFRATSAMRVQLFHACQRCEHMRPRGGQNED